MPLDGALPPPRLPRHVTTDQIARHFPAAFGVRVDADDLPASERLGLAGARLPEPPEARLLDRVLQVVPPRLADAAERILIVDNGVQGREGGYLSSIVRLYTPALRLTLADPRSRGRYSLFTTTVLHELGHAIYERRLSPHQQEQAPHLYLGELAEATRPTEAEPSQAGAEHHFVDLFVAGIIYPRAEIMRKEGARALLREIGLSIL